MTGLPIAAARAIGLVSKATAVLSVALILAWFARRGSAKTLHLLWTTTFALLLVLPMLSLLAPSWDLPILPAQATAIEHHLPGNTAKRPIIQSQFCQRGPPATSGASIPDQTRAAPRSGRRFDPAGTRRWRIPDLGTRLRGWAHLPHRRRPSFPEARAAGNPDSRKPCVTGT